MEGWRGGLAWNHDLGRGREIENSLNYKAYYKKVYNFYYKYAFNGQLQAWNDF